MIDFPIKVLDKSKQVNFIYKKNRVKLFRRNIYHYIYKGKKNHLMKKRPFGKQLENYRYPKNLKT